MRTSISFAVEIDLGDMISTTVDEARQQIRPTAVTDPAALTNLLLNITGKAIHGYEAMGGREQVTVRLPVELWYPAVSTCFRPDYDLSILQVVAQHLGIARDRIVAEYPASDKAQEVISRLCDERDRAEVTAMQRAQRKIAMWLRDQADACHSEQRVDALMHAATCIELGVVR